MIVYRSNHVDTVHTDRQNYDDYKTAQRIATRGKNHLIYEKASDEHKLLQPTETAQDSTSTIASHLTDKHQMGCI